MPDFPEGDLAIDNHHPDMETRTYEIQVITPLFGGGVEAGKIDPELPIRPSSIRGHLRFWWRATKGAKYATIENLRQREGEIWGSMENPSPVVIVVTSVNLDSPTPCARYDPNNERHRYDLRWNSPFAGRENPLPYILFPYQGKSPDSLEPKDPSEMIRSCNFTLTVKIPSTKKMAIYRSEYNEQRNKKHLLPLCDEDDNLIKDVEAAVWAWVNFGGIGARTRRGCGALFCKKANPENLEQFSIIPPVSDSQEIRSWYLSCLNYLGIDTSTNCKWPTVLRKILLKTGGNRTDIQCWIESVSIIKKFRQGEDIGRNKGRGSRPGQSRWPEAESLRTVVYGSGERPNGIHPVDSRMTNIPAFPRVEFGMPIILEIRNEGIKPTLQYTDEKDRMASPLILRPLKCRDGLCSSMIVRLNTPKLTSAYVKPGQSGGDKTYPGEITANEIESSGNISYIDSPMKGRCKNGSALDAFIAFAQEKGNDFVEVPK